VRGILGSVLDCPFAIDTDVNGAALAEYRWGAGQGCDSLCYITIGTGVGGGLVIGGRPVHGALHPEMGHLRLRRTDGDVFEGACKFHRDCIEGLISGPALAARFGGDPALASESDPRWKHVASDIAELAAAVLLTASAERVVIGGGVGVGRRFLLPLVRAILVQRLGGYLQFVDDESVQQIVCSPSLGQTAGPLGALALGLMAADGATKISNPSRRARRMR
jgi:fructokinase